MYRLPASTMSITQYALYVKPKYENDPSYRKQHIERVLAWQNSVKDDEEYKKKRREISKRYYENHPSYREKKKERNQRARAMQNIATISPLPTKQVCM